MTAKFDETSSRDRHLFGPGQKRILSLDGGGIRGIVAIAFLRRIEELLAEARGTSVRLCDYFDLIGGTSTGGIIATALALGHSAAEVRQFYLTMAPRVFRKPRMRVPGWRPRFDGEALRREISSVVGDRTLGSNDLKTGLAVMLKRLDAAGAWLLTNNPRAKYWNTPADQSFVGNRHYPLESVIRASAAAPTYFDLQTIEISAGAPMGVFVDGGLTAHNDPTLALLLHVALPVYAVEWALHPDLLAIVSLGTGWFRERESPRALMRATALGIALSSLKQQIAESQQLALTLMSWLGRGGAPWPINSEIGNLRAVEPSFGPLFRFARYDLRLESDWLSDVLGVTISERELAAIRRFENSDALHALDEIASRAAAMQVRLADFDNV
jgi:uncharacterized protein